MGKALAKVERSFDWEWYGREVIAGNIPVCRWTRLAVERHYRDIADGGKRGLYFSDAHAQHALESFLFLRHSKGEFKGRQFIPSPHQQFWIALTFGWRRGNGTRRFRELIKFEPRKNGKTTETAGLGIYCFYFDGEGGAEAYVVATKLDQAKILFGEAERMIASSPLLRRKIASRINELYIPGEADVFRPLGRDSKTLDGLNPSAAMFDETHAMPNRDLYDVIKTGMGSRRQGLIVCISTAGDDLSSFGYEQYKYATRVLDGSVEDDEVLAVIYTVDDRAKWDDETEWAKANPNMGVSVHLDEMRDFCKRAKRQPAQRAAFETKRLNIWQTSGRAWITREDWMNCADPTIRIEEFIGCDCFMALDLAEKRDVAAVCLMFYRNGKWYVFFRLYLNREEVEENNSDRYRGWERIGELIVNEGNATDFDLIRQHITEDSKRFKIKEIPYDPKFSAYFVTKMVEEGLPMVTIAQTASHFTLPIIEIENMVLTQQIVHQGSEAVAWMMGNVVMRESKFTGLKHPTKESNDLKIDAPVAMLLCAGRALLHKPAPSYDDYIASRIGE